MLFLLLTSLLVVESQDSPPNCPTVFPDYITSYFATTIQVYTYNLLTPDQVSLDKDMGNGEMVILSTTPASDFIAFSVYFTAAGSFSFKVNCGEDSQTFTISITQAVLGVNADSQPIYTGTRFRLISTIQDRSYQASTVEIDSFNCTWNLTQNGINVNSYVLGPFTTLSSNSQCIFEGIRVKVSGYYQLTVYAGLSTVISNSVSLQFSSKSAKFLSISMSTYEPTVYFAFNVTVWIYSDATTPYYESSTISLSEESGSAIFGTTSASTSTAFYTFLIYFNTLGSKVITASVTPSNYYYQQISARSMVFVQSEFINATLSLIVIDN